MRQMMTGETIQAVIQNLLRDEDRDAIVAAAGDSPCHLVGGAVRDRLVLGRDTRDWDLIVLDHGAAVADRLARTLGGRVVNLGGERFASYRVASPGRVLDLWDRRGTPMETELHRRDLTLNSIAVDLRTGEVIDPTGGLSDVAGRTLRCNAPERFAEDPVRILRLLRFGVQMPDFEIESETLESARASAYELQAVAAERIREELDKALGRLPASRLGDLLTTLDLFPRLWAPDASHDSRADLGDQIQSADDDLSSVLDAIDRPAAEAELVAFHHALLLMACDARSECPISPKTPLRRSSDLLARRLVSRATWEITRSLLSASELPRDEDSRRLFLHGAGEQWPMRAVLASRRERGFSPEDASALLRSLVALDAAEGQRLRDLEPLLDGADLRRRFDLEAGPPIGELLRSLERAQVLGRVANQREAIEWIERELRTERRVT